MKRKTLISVLNILFFLNVLSQVTDISYSYQYLLTYDGAQSSDYVGKFYSCFTYDTVNAITFAKLLGNNAFEIDAENGMVYIDEPFFLKPGRDTISIQVCDGKYCGTYKAVITVISEDSCFFIDPEAEAGGDGSYDHPYDSWTDISSGTFQAGYAYMQKRGTVENRATNNALIAISNSQGTEENHISIGAYGIGHKPVVINANPSGSSIIYGKLGAEGAKYVDTYELEIKNCTGVLVENASYNHHLMLSNITISNCTNNAGFYVKWPGTSHSTPFDMDINVFNMVSFNNSSHCIKADRNVNITNALLYNASKHGLSMVGANSEVRYVHSFRNGTYGIEIQNDSNRVSKCVLHDNYKGLMFDQNDWKHNTVDSCYIYHNSSTGIDAGGTYHATISNNYIDDNYGAGISISDYSESISIWGNRITNSLLSGVHIHKYSGYGLKTFNINRNVFYGNKESLFVEEGRHVFFYNNTCFAEGIKETTSGYVVAKNNIISSLEGDWGASNNLLTETDTIYEDATNFDFHLVSSATNAVDKGADVQLTTDFDGNSVPYPGSNAPDIGAFEYQGIIITGVDELIGNDNKWSVYPNPFDDYIFIKSAQKVTHLIILDMQGRVFIEQKQPITEDVLVDLSMLDVGNYLIKLTNLSGEVAYKKVFKR